MRAGNPGHTNEGEMLEGNFQDSLGLQAGCGLVVREIIADSARVFRRQRDGASETDVVLSFEIVKKEQTGHSNSLERLEEDNFSNEK